LDETVICQQTLKRSSGSVERKQLANQPGQAPVVVARVESFVHDLELFAEIRVLAEPFLRQEDGMARIHPLSGVGVRDGEKEPAAQPEDAVALIDDVVEQGVLKEVR
jgi:hypothetical protein